MSYPFNKFLKAFKALFLSQYSLMLEYRAEIVLWAISGLLPLIILSLWLGDKIENSIFDNRSQLISYYFSVFIVRQFTAVWVMVTFEEDNLKGKLSPYLLNPISPFWRYFSSHLAEQFTRLPFVVLMITTVGFVFKDSIVIPKFNSVFIFCIILFFSFLLRFMIHWTFAIFCLWNDKASSIERLLLIPYLFISGLVLPIDSFPDIIKKFAMMTPFPYIISLPANILIGSNNNLLSEFFILLIWILFFIVVSNIIWQKGIRYYSGMGS